MRIVKFQLDHTPDADVQILTTADLFKDRLSHRHIYLGEQIVRGIEDLEGVETCYHHRYAVFVHFGKLFDAGEVTKRIMDYLDSYVFKPLTAHGITVDVTCGWDATQAEEDV